MKQPMQAGEQHFLLYFNAVFGRTIPGHGWADKNFSIGKRDDVGLGRIAHEVAMNSRHRRPINEDELDFGELRRKRTRQKRQRRLKPPQKRADTNWHFA